MELGFIGLGRMGLNMVKRMLNSGGVDVYVYNRSPEPVEEAKKLGAKGADSVEDLVSKLKQEKKIVWLMLPAGRITASHFEQVIGLLGKGDIVIDGANSNFHDTMKRHTEARARGIDMLDVGVSGGIIAAERGYPMMIGGKPETYEYCKPIFESFGIEGGYGHMGPGGAGHYVKMIHNAVEYGMMQAIAEGFDLMAAGRFPELDLHKISKVWNHGTIVDSFLMDMTERALADAKTLEEIEPYVAESGEGRWAAKEAIDKGVPFPVNTIAVHERFSSQDKNSYANRLLAGIRYQFGAHEMKKK